MLSRQSPGGFLKPGLEMNHARFARICTRPLALRSIINPIAPVVYPSGRLTGYCAHDRTSYLAFRLAV